MPTCAGTTRTTATPTSSPHNAANARASAANVQADRVARPCPLDFDRPVSVELALVSLGAAAVHTATKLWLGDHPIVAAVGVNVVDQLAGKLVKVIDRRRLTAMFDRFAEAVAERLEPIIESEFRSVPEHERLAAINAVCDTFAQASLRDEDFFAADLDAGHLARSIRARKLTELLSADATELYDLLLRECCGYVIEISRGLPTFSVNVLTELLRRDREILDGIREVLERLPQRDRGAGFEYDYRQLVARKLDRVEMFGVAQTDASRRYPLSVAYVSLTASTDETGPARRVEKLLVNVRRVLIRGEAGLGKTTLLHWIAVRSALRDFPPSLQEWNRTIPFFVPLRRYVHQDLPAPEQFFDEVGRHIADEMPRGWAQASLRAGRAVLLVDGVDEFPESRRDDVRRWLGDLIAAFPQARFVVTSRPAAIDATWLQADDFSILTLQPMARQDVQEFIQRWHDAIRSVHNDEDTHREVDDFRRAMMAQVETRSHLRKLARYPLLCALLCALNRHRRSTLPTNRMELYEVALQLLLEQLDAEKKIDAVPGLDRREKLLLLGDLAYWLIRNGYSETDRERVIDQFRQSLRTMAHVKSDEYGVYLHLLERSGLLREPVADRVDFVHRTFQEYLAASAAINADDVGTLVANAHSHQWHGVLVMAVGHASRRQRMELITGLLKRGDVDLLTVACMETAPELSPELREQVEERATQLLPPKSIAQATSLAAAGEFVLDLLAACEPTTELEAAATVRALAETGEEDALPIIATHVSGPHDDVFLELLRNWPMFEHELYAETVLTKCGARTIKADRLEALEAARYLQRLTHVKVPYSRSFEAPGALDVLLRARNLSLHSWPAAKMAWLPRGLHLDRLELHRMMLDDLRTLDFVDQVNVIRVRSCHLQSLAGIERWANVLTEIEVTQTLVPADVAHTLSTGLPDLHVTYEPYELNESPPMPVTNDATGHKPFEG